MKPKIQPTGVEIPLSDDDLIVSMPRGMFKLLWDYIRNGEEYNGFIMNLCKNGSFYWVYTNVTPSYDASGNLIGYYSARRKCTQCRKAGGRQGGHRCFHGCTEQPARRQRSHL